MTRLMDEGQVLLLRHHLKALKLPTMLGEYAKLSREASEARESYEGYLLRLSELEVAQRTANALTARLRAASFPLVKDLESFDFTLTPSLSKPQVLELAQCRWIDDKSNCCLIGNSGTGKTHLAVALGRCACRAGKRVRFFTAATLVNQLEEAQKNYRLEKLLDALERIELLIVDELGYLSFSPGGAELLFQVFANRYERRSMLITSNLPFGEWATLFHGERLTAALLDRLTHHCQILQMNGESYRFRQSVSRNAGRNSPSKAKASAAQPAAK